MRWTVRTEDVSSKLLPAAAPVCGPQSPSAATGGLVRFAAAPGTQAVPSPRPDLPSGAGLNGGPSNAGAPNAFLPRLAVPFADNMQPPVRWVSTNEIPIPAGDFVRLPQIASKAPPRIGGRGVIPQPRAFPRWPSRVRSVVSDG